MLYTPRGAHPGRQERMGWFPPYELVSGTDGLVPTLRLLLQTRMGWFPPYETWRDLLTPDSSSQEKKPPLC